MLDGVLMYCINVAFRVGVNPYGSFHVRSTNGLRVTPPISMKVGTRADNA